MIGMICVFGYGSVDYGRAEELNVGSEVETGQEVDCFVGVWRTEMDCYRFVIIITVVDVPVRWIVGSTVMTKQEW
jgi:hypothetical protein